VFSLCELGGTKLELFASLKQAIILHWELRDLDMQIFSDAKEYSGFVDYFKY